MKNKFNNMFKEGFLPKPLDNEEQLKYLEEAKYNKEARDKVIVHNLRLITTAAYMYAKKFNCELDELQEIGIEILDNCIKRYRTDSNASFKTYLITSLNRNFHRYLMKEKSIHDTVFSINTSDTDVLDSYNHEYEFTVQNDDAIIDTEVNLFDDYVEKEMNEEIKDIIDKLPLDDLKILHLHLGFDGNPKTFQEVADILKLSISTVTRKYYSTIKNIKNEYYLKLLSSHADLFYITIANIIIFGKENDDFEKIYYNLEEAKIIFGILDRMNNKNKNFIKDYLGIYESYYRKDLQKKYNIQKTLELDECYNSIMSSILNDYIEMSKNNKIKIKN